MWLDRLSSHTTPSVSPPPMNRSSSQRQQSNLAPHGTAQRPYNPRSSSLLSLRSNDSTSSLSALKKSNGTSSKSTNVISGVSDPLEVLQSITGAEKTQSSNASNPTKTSGDLFIEQNDFELDLDGLSLQDLILQKYAEDEEVHVPKPQSIEEYQRDKEKFDELHESIRACDDVLNSVEISLTSFQNDLAAVSAEIETLQARSTALGIRLENRKQVENGLGPIVEEISISPVVVRKIVDGVIDEAWVGALAEVEKRSKAMDAKSKELRNIKGINDLKPLLGNLIQKALERIRDFLVTQIKALRSPNINAQIIQQQYFIRYKDLYAFMHRHHAKLAEEICQAYLNTMRWYFLNQFTRYRQALEKVKLHILDRHDAIGNDDGTRKTHLLTTSKFSGPPHDAFNLGRRIDLLKTMNQNALSSFVAEEDRTTHYLESPFRNFNLALVDNASAEYSFLTSFFSPALSYTTISKHFNYIFEPTFALGNSLTKSLIAETVDGLGLLLCVRLTQHFAFELQRRKIPAVDGYINGTSMLLWPRFQVVMDAHCDSVRTATNNVSTRKPSASEAAKQSAAPHFMTQRFGQFMHGILALSTEAGDDEPVSTSLTRLRSEMEAFLTKTGKAIGEFRKRERFLYNNYSLILTIVGDVNGNLAAEQQEHFEGLKKAFGE